MALGTKLPRSTPEAHGIASSAILDFLRAVEAQELHSVMLLRHGEVLAEGWWKPYGPTVPHALFSVSKSFTALAVGLAIDEGLLDLDDAVVSLLPDDAPELTSDNLAAMRVRHLLTMSTGHADDTISALTESDVNWARTLLSVPVEYEPGTRFIYNTGATYLLSAIVQKLTGERLLDYLTPRLFARLDIVGATWERCPRGIDVGGWGLSITTEDIARFGQLCLQRGAWNGDQLVPAAWIDAATSSQVPNGDPLVPDDGMQGYGFQFWRCRHGAYRADGAFGQLCIVMPEHEAVLVLTGALGDPPAVMAAAWQHLLPALSPTGLPADDAAHAALSGALAVLELPHPFGAFLSPTARRVSRVRFDLPATAAPLDAVSVRFEHGSATLTTWDEHGEHAVDCGYGSWTAGHAPLDGRPDAPVSAAATWLSETVWVARLQYHETPFAFTFTFDFAGETTGEEVKVRLVQNVSFGSNELLNVVGVRTTIGE